MIQVRQWAARRLAFWMAGAVLLLGSSLGAMAQDIVIGQIGPFTGIPVPDAKNVNMGIKAYVEQVNKNGGINGRKISFFELDDGYNGDGFAMRMAEAMQRKPVALISPIGSAAMKRMLDDKLLDKYDVIVMNAIPGAELFRNPGHPHLFHVRAGDKQQLERIVNNVQTLGITKLAVLHQDISIGTSGMKVVADEVARLKHMDVKGVQSSTEPAALAAASQDVMKLNAQGVVVVGSPPFMAAGVAQLRKSGVTQPIYVLSYVPAGLLVKLAGQDGARGVAIAQTFPNPNGKTHAVLRDFRSAMMAAWPDTKSYSSFQLEGYISARVVGEALRRAKDTRSETLAKALHAMGEFDMGGYRVDFSKSNVGSHFVDIGVVDLDGVLRY